MSFTVLLHDLDDSQRDAWLQARQLGIGGSDAAPAIGLSEWRSPLAIWLAKTARLPHLEEDGSTENERWGRRLEPVLRDALAERLALPVEHTGALLRSDEVPLMVGTPDAFVGKTALAELKVVGPRMLGRWDAGPPLEVEIQALHYAAITGAERVYVAALLGGVHFEVWPVDRDADTQRLLADQEVAFWRFVESDEPPPVDGRESTTRALEDAYPESVAGEAVELDEEARLWIIRRRSAKEVQREAEERQAEAENALRLLLGSASVGLIAGGRVIERRSHMARKVDLDGLRAIAPELVAAHTTEEQRRRWWTPKEDER
jgi:predicted phage-related endonuclease